MCDLRSLQERTAKTIQGAWDLFNKDHTIVTLEACGLRNSDRVARSKPVLALKQAIKRRKLDGEERVKKMHGCARKDLRNAGFKFANATYSPSASSTACRSRAPAGTAARAETSYPETKFLYFLIDHMVCDSVPLPTWHNVMRSVASELNMEAAYCTKVERWMLGKRHCRYADWRSDATKTVLTYVQQLEGCTRKLLFVLLVVSACNHRDTFHRFYELAAKLPEETPDLKLLRLDILAAIGDQGWLAQPRRYPVSAATAYNCGLPKHERSHARLREKVADLTMSKCVYFSKRLRATNTQSLSAHDVREALDLCDVLGGLQSACFMRYLGLPFAEQFTAYSGKYMPVASTPTSIGDSLRLRVAGSSVLTGVVGSCVPAEERSHLWQGRHIEHGACEWRKMLDNSGLSRG